MLQLFDFDHISAIVAINLKVIGVHDSTTTPSLFLIMYLNNSTSQ